MQPAGEYTREETVPYKTNEPVVNPELKPGEVRIIEGTPGKNVYSYTITEVDGELVKSAETLIESVKPVNTIIQVGPDTELGTDYTTTRTVPYEVDVIYDDTLPRGQVITEQYGINTVYETEHTVTFDKDGNPIVTDGEEKLVVQGNPHIIRVGTKDVPEAVSTVEEDIPFETEVIVDKTIAPGQVVEVQAGELGTQETKYVTKVVDGEIVTVAEEPVVTKEPVKRIIRVGQLPFSSEEEIPFEIEIIEDENLPAGETVVDQEGEVGTKTTTFNLVDGKIVETEEVTKEPVKKIVRVGKKTTPTDGTFTYDYTTKESYDVEVIYDNTMDARTMVVDQEGQNGISTTTTTVTIKDSIVVAENTETTVVQTKQNKIIRVGTKEVEKEISKDHAVVIVNYVDENGLPIASTVVDSVELKGSAYDTTDNKPETIEFNGKVYELVPTSTIGNETGTMNQTLTQVTYVYKVKVDPEVKKGSVIVKYIDEKGNRIKDSLVDTLGADYGTGYDTTDNKPTTIEFDGKTYELVKVQEGDVEKGTINSPETTVTYIYKLKETSKDPTKPEDPETTVITKYIDEKGNPVARQENGTKNKKNIPGYEYVTTVTDKDGNTTHIYKKVQTPVGKVVTNFVDEKGNVISDRVDGKQNPKAISGYRYVRTVTDPNGNTTHVYKLVEEEKPTDPVAPEKPVTRYVDKDGNVVAKQEDGKSPKKDVDGYEFVETKTDENGNTIHIYKKPESTTPEKDVDTSFVDKDGKAIVPKEEGEKDKKDLDGYKFVATKKDDKGNITRVYEKSCNNSKHSKYSKYFHYFYF